MVLATRASTLSMTLSEPRTSVWSVRLLASAPFCYLALLYLFVLRARWQLGFWPRPSQPDPKSLGFDFHHSLVWLAALGFPFAVLLAILLALRGYAAARRPFPWLLIGFVAFGVAAVLGASCIDPGYFCGWFAD